MFKQPAPTIQTTTLWDFPSQHYGNAPQGDGNFAGVTPSYIIWNLLQRYTQVGDAVLDPMCGSGTTLDVCRDLKRRGLGFDLNPQRPDIKVADARKIPLTDASCDFIFLDPPYGNHLRYSGKEACIGETDARDGSYYAAMEAVMVELFRVLRDGKYLALYVQDSAAKDKPFCPIGFELFARLSRLFEPVDIACVARHHKTLKRNHWHTEAIAGNYYLRGFNYLLIFRKNRSGSPEGTRHSQSGALSPYFQAFAAASKAKGDVPTPESFAAALQRGDIAPPLPRMAPKRPDLRKRTTKKKSQKRNPKWPKS